MSNERLRYEIANLATDPAANPADRQTRTYVFGPGTVQMLCNGVVIREWYCSGLTITSEDAEGGRR
jgi:hypothetical protein